jgi:hypothetical protein
VQDGGGEERTAGSDQKVRYSSGGPISPDPIFTFLKKPYLPHNSRLSVARLGGEGGRGGRWGEREGGGGVDRPYTKMLLLYIYLYVPWPWLWSSV